MAGVVAPVGLRGGRSPEWGICGRWARLGAVAVMPLRPGLAVCPGPALTAPVRRDSRPHRLSLRGTPGLVSCPFRFLADTFTFTPGTELFLRPCGHAFFPGAHMPMIHDDLDRWFPPAGECCCGRDARHRLLGEICAAVATGKTAEQVSEETGLPLEAVDAAVRLWDLERGFPK